MTRSRLILLVRCVTLAFAIWLGAESLWLAPVALIMPPSILGGGGYLPENCCDGMPWPDELTYTDDNGSATMTKASGLPYPCTSLPVSYVFTHLGNVYYVTCGMSVWTLNTSGVCVLIKNLPIISCDPFYARWDGELFGIPVFMEITE